MAGTTDSSRGSWLSGTGGRGSEGDRRRGEERGRGGRRRMRRVGCRMGTMFMFVGVAKKGRKEEGRMGNGGRIGKRRKEGRKLTQTD